MTAGSEEVDAKIASVGGWRGEMLARIRKLIRKADPDIVEAVKWRKPSNPSGVPVWEHAGVICTGETYKDKVKLTFAQGAKVDLKRELKELYAPPRTPVLVDVPPLTFLMVDGRGDPNVATAYREAIAALYGVSYTMKFALKRAPGGVD